MKKLSPFIVGLCLGLARWQPAAAQLLDPAFASPRVYASGTVFSALEQPDGKRVVTGHFGRANGTAAFALSRYEPNGTLDAGFQQNIGVADGATRTRLLGNGQLMTLSPTGTVTVGGLTRQSLLRLNANGSPDASFDIGTGPDFLNGAGGFFDDFLPLPNGQIIGAGYFERFSGVPANGIVRLTATGAVDPTFSSGAGIDITANNDIFHIVPLPNGQLLLGGIITSYDNHPARGLVRVNADGSFDPSFVPALGPNSRTSSIVVQPDGKVLLAGFFYFGTSTTAQGITRLLPTGAVDPTFTPPANLAVGNLMSVVGGNSLQLQPDGKILLISQGGAAAGLAPVGRLNADGTPDPSFQAGTGPNQPPYTITLLASGKILVGGDFTDFSGIYDRPLVQVNSDGTLDASFRPIIQIPGTIAVLGQQADGKRLAGGDFMEINGQEIRRLARFNANGTLDAAFVPYDGPDAVVDLALQPDGRLLAATPLAIRRYLSSGAPDNTFLPPSLSSSNLRRLLLQPDGAVLLGGTGSYSVGSQSGTPTLVRLLANGTFDNSFAPATTGAGRVTNFQQMALQPDGKVLVAGSYLPSTGPRLQTVVRLDPSGAVDPGFAGSAVLGASTTAGFNALQVQPDGKVLVGGLVRAYGGVPRSGLARLSPDGSLDPGFVPPTLSGEVHTLLVQPNGRVLVGGLFAGNGLPSNLARLLDNGQPDATYGATARPDQAVRALLVQPDGKLVAGGSFSTVAGQPAMALARITASNVLHVAAPRAVAERTTAWPVPAHTHLTVAPDASAHPQALDLLDALGRPVLHQALNGSSTATLPLESLAAGTYLLRVTYAEGTVMRRVQVQ